jgi:demethylmenaquinone methyltransferase/2-methoxy-6-polyprenyl-1,4-benzoquinol methylase
LFSAIADRYDLITILLSFGADHRWKRRLVRLSGATPDARVLDLATGTGDIAYLFRGRGRLVVGLDVTRRMIELAVRKRGAGTSPKFLVGDMMALPFASGSFDLVTTGYGLRNVPDLAASIAEIYRVLDRGGQALSLDFNRPTNALIRGVYLSYLSVVGGALGWLLHRDPDTYRYIPASIRNYAGAEGVARIMTACGFATVAWYPVLGGLMAIHHARK